MELRLYWRIVRRRLWIVLCLLCLVLLSYLLLPPSRPVSYVANMRFVVGLAPDQDPGRFYTYDRYYTWLTAEYLIDDFAEVVQSKVFAQDVASFAGLDVAAGVVQGATSAGKLHRILTIEIVWPDREELTRIADAVAQVLRERGDAYFAQLATDTAVVFLIDPPQLSRVAPSLRQRLDLPLRLILALGAGIFLAFLLDYLDDNVRHMADLAQLGLPILAEIPPERRSVTRFWRQRSMP